VRAGVIDLETLKQTISEAEKSNPHLTGIGGAAYRGSMGDFWRAVEDRRTDITIPGRTYGDLGIPEAQLPAGPQAAQPSKGNKDSGTDDQTSQSDD
jgi:hypothetical protein